MNTESFWVEDPETDSIVLHESLKIYTYPWDNVPPGRYKLHTQNPRQGAHDVLIQEVMVVTDQHGSLYVTYNIPGIMARKLTSLSRNSVLIPE